MNTYLSKYQYKGQGTDHYARYAKRNACFVKTTVPEVECDKETGRWCKPQQLGEQVKGETHNAVLACAKRLCAKQEERARKQGDKAEAGKGKQPFGKFRHDEMQDRGG